MVLYIQDVLGQDDEGRVMECLIEHKYELNHECAAGITHFQLVNACVVFSML